MLFADWIVDPQTSLDRRRPWDDFAFRHRIFDEPVSVSVGDDLGLADFRNISLQGFFITSRNPEFLMEVRSDVCGSSDCFGDWWLLSVCKIHQLAFRSDQNALAKWDGRTDDRLLEIRFRYRLKAVWSYLSNEDNTIFSWGIEFVVCHKGGGVKVRAAFGQLGFPNRLAGCRI